MIGRALPSTHEWRRVTDIQAGDRVHRWGDELLVTAVELGADGRVYISVDDEGTIKKWSYRAADELSCMKRSPQPKQA